jgi:23S rRNA (uracil1939-C5)-methyltransferase
VEIEITGMTATGDGVGRHEGKVVFVAGALPGERVTAEIVRRGAKFDRARVVEVTREHGRRETPCPHDHPAGCGGCSLLHATREAQAAAKGALVRDALVRLGGVADPLVRETRTPGPELGYRNHARFGVGTGGKLTYVARRDDLPEPRPHARRQHLDVIAIDACAVLHPRLDELRAALAGKVAGASEVELRLGAGTGERLVILHGTTRCPAALDPTRVDASIVLSDGDRLVPVRGTPWIHEIVLGTRFRVSARSFFQVNTDGAAELAGIVRGFAAEGAAARALDLYAGVGLFTLTALSAAERVVAVEIEPASSDDLRRNVAGRAGVSLRCEPVDDVLRDLRPGRDVFDLAIVNPPRAGMGEAVVRALAPLAVPRLVLVSCDPGSLARDVATLGRTGYVLREAIPVDQFPGTPHVETLAVLDRRL